MCDSGKLLCAMLSTCGLVEHCNVFINWIKVAMLPTCYDTCYKSITFVHVEIQLPDLIVVLKEATNRFCKDTLK